MSFVKTKNLKIVFAGTPKLGAIILEELVKAGAKIPLVLTKADKPAGRGKKITPTPVRLIAQKFKIPTISPTKLDSEEFIAKLKEVKPDLIVVAAYGKIFPKALLNLSRYSVLNVHPSLLPKFRGPSPIQFAILAGVEKTGVTIIKMSENLDEGDILTQVQVPISPSDTTQSLTEKLAKMGAKLLIQTIPKWVKGQIKPKSQDHLKAIYSAMLTKYDGKIDLEAPPAPEKFNRMVRAYYPWPGVYAKLKIQNQKEKIIKFLPGDLIQLEGKKAVSIQEFLNGFPQAKQQLAKLQLVQ